MSIVAPVGPASEYRPRREDELERIEPANKQPVEDKPPAAVDADVQKQAEKTTLNDFKYTGKGSFVDKIF